VDGWLVLRFSREDVMFERDYVRQVLTAIVALVHRSTEVGGPVCPDCAAA
jgi:very-short-patch-repair endonuclease